MCQEAGPQQAHRLLEAGLRAAESTNGRYVSVAETPPDCGTFFFLNHSRQNSLEVGHVTNNDKGMLQNIKSKGCSEVMLTCPFLWPAGLR